MSTAALTSQALLRVLQLASPVLPIGGFHFSQGLEYAVEAGWVSDEATALEWIAGLGGASLATLDLPLLARLHDAWVHGEPTVTEWNRFLYAARETAELRAEERHLGTALAKVLTELGITAAVPWRQRTDTTFAAMFALACTSWQVPRDAALDTFAWIWVETQTLAAVKLVPLGQMAGQRLLSHCIAQIPGWISQAVSIEDDDIGIATVMQGMASARHESQYTRLFRS